LFGPELRSKNTHVTSQSEPVSADTPQTSCTLCEDSKLATHRHQQLCGTTAADCCQTWLCQPLIYLYSAAPWYQDKGASNVSCSWPGCAELDTAVMRRVSACSGLNVLLVMRTSLPLSQPANSVVLPDTVMVVLPAAAGTARRVHLLATGRPCSASWPPDTAASTCYS
jgi:hypothetical protein